MWRTIILGIGMAFLVVGVSEASEFTAPGAKSTVKGTLAFAPDSSWAKEVPESELGEMRGGYFGFSLGFLATGFFDSLGVTSGNIGFNLDSTVLAEPVQVTDSTAEFGVALGTSSFNGFNGFVQNLDITGNLVVAQQTLQVNINLFTVPNAATVQNLLTQLGSTSFTIPQ